MTEIEQYIVGNMLYTRFCYTTGDAAGQNMTGKATLYACEWIRAKHPESRAISCPATSTPTRNTRAMNMIQTRGKRVVAEFILKRDVAKELLRIDTAWLYKYRQIASVGTHLAGGAYSGAHAANGIAAMFIATGQDAANVAESHAGLNYGELLDNGDFYWSVTLPALICATYGGGTGLQTQRECLEMMDCYGTGKATSWPRSLPPSYWRATCRCHPQYSPTNGSAATRKWGATASMKIRRDHEYAHSTDTVYALFTDRKAIRAKQKALGSRNLRIEECKRNAGGAVVSFVRELPADVPGVLSKFVQPWNTVEQSEQWTCYADGVYQAELDVDIAGVPVTVAGTL